MTPEPSDAELHELFSDGPYWLARKSAEDDDVEKVLLAVRGVVLSGIRSMVADFKRPEYRAGFCVGVLLAVILERQGMRPLPSALLGAMAAMSVERLYVMAADVHETSIAQREYLERQSGEAR